MCACVHWSISHLSSPCSPASVHLENSITYSASNEGQIFCVVFLKQLHCRAVYNSNSCVIWLPLVMDTFYVFLSNTKMHLQNGSYYLMHTTLILSGLSGGGQGKYLTHYELLVNYLLLYRNSAIIYTVCTLAMCPIGI